MNDPVITALQEALKVSKVRNKVRNALAAADTPADGLSQDELCYRTGFPRWIVNDALCDLRDSVGNHKVAFGRKRVTKYYLKDKSVGKHPEERAEL